MTSPLAVALNDIAASGINRRVGTVKTTTPLVVETSTGDLAATAYMDSYTPTVDHVVLVLVDKSGAAIVMGRLMPA